MSTRTLLWSQVDWVRVCLFPLIILHRQCQRVLCRYLYCTLRCTLRLAMKLPFFLERECPWVGYLCHIVVIKKDNHGRKFLSCFINFTVIFCFVFCFSKGGNVNIRLHCKISFHLLLFHEISIYSGIFVTKNIAKWNTIIWSKIKVRGLRVRHSLLLHCWSVLARNPLLHLFKQVMAVHQGTPLSHKWDIHLQGEDTQEVMGDLKVLLQGQILPCGIGLLLWIETDLDKSLQMSCNKLYLMETGHNLIVKPAV